MLLEFFTVLIKTIDCRLNLKRDLLKKFFIEFFIEDPLR